MFTRAREAVAIIKRLGRGNHISLLTAYDTDEVEQIFVDEIGRQVMESIGVATVQIKLHSAARHRYQVKLGPVYNKDGSLNADSLKAVLLNHTYFDQALAPALARYTEAA
jgi:hypothetical protein